MFSSVPSAGQGDALLRVWTSVGQGRVYKLGLALTKLMGGGAGGRWVLGAGIGAVGTLRQDLWGTDRRHWRLNLQPGWKVIANLEGDNSHEWLWCSLCTSRSYCNATEPLTQPRTKGMPRGIWISLFAENSVFLANTNLSSFSLPFYILTKTSNKLHFSLKLSCTLYLIGPHICMFTFHCYHTNTVQASESFSPLLAFSTGVHIYHSVDLVSVFTIV